ncbi:MAG: carboxypeptidase-like regulatory domain-containing protein [Saprospiraceae bacterium]|nr:carboxypeptidase-like regulatory domain-containing protein [Saprospiraceae bacterium]
MRRLLPGLLFVLLSVSSSTLWGQRTEIYGLVRDQMSGEPVEFATIFKDGDTNAAESDLEGRYRLEVLPGERLIIKCTRIGYKQAEFILTPLPSGSRQRIDFYLVSSESGVEVIVRESRIEERGMIREDVSNLKLIPSTSGNFESVLPAIALGASSGSGGELTSQYNVRGGNYDENLVYVNDFEIYRPQLIRAGQQEGLSFPNIDLIRDISFSSGGFEARYGDKMSSVLDIRYKRPDSLRASVSGSALGATGHLEGSLKIGRTNTQRLRYLVGARYKTNQYLLNSLDVQGEYVPNFTDFQAYLTYDINRDLQVALIGNYNRSVYQYKPVSRSTAFGFVTYALRLFSVYEGQEDDRFTQAMTGVSLTYLPEKSRRPLYLKLLASTFNSREVEGIDIIGAYRLSEIDINPGSENFEREIAVLGTGIQHTYVRNQLNFQVSQLEHKGGIEWPSWLSGSGRSAHFLQWGAKGSHEWILDHINEWERLDSAGYSLPYDLDQVRIQQVVKTRNELQSLKFSAYIQHSWTWTSEDVMDVQVISGLRGGYWNLNKEPYLTPRLQMLFKPLRGKKRNSFRFASGLYYQPPFYRELRSLEGLVNESVEAQKSWHVVGGYTRDFFMGKNKRMPFHFTMEAYYKQLWDLVGYDVDNVRIRYAGQNNATGYVTGVDFRINGEFVPEAESWINLSFLRARESLRGVDHLVREIGDPAARAVKDVPRPSDQFMSMSMFFQDYLPKNKNIRAHIHFTVGTGLPFGIPNDNIVYRNTYRFSPYHRLDAGFSAQIWDRERLSKRPHHPLRFTRNTWLSLEVFNLFGVRNEASYTWIKTVYNTQYGVPNYLTGRRVNLRLRVEL